MLCFFQYGCTGSQLPSNLVLKDALELQMNLTHFSLDELLQTKLETPELTDLKVDSSTYLDNSNGRILSISGRINYRYPDEIEKVKGSFQMFLERGKKGESWRLAKPVISLDGISKEWLTYPLPIKITA